MERFQDKRIWLGGGLVSALLLVAVAWFMFIGPEISSTSALKAQTVTTQQQNALLQLKLKSLEDKKAQLGKYTASLKTALESLPVDSGLPAFTRQLTAQARATGVNLFSVSAGGVSPVAAAAPVAPTVATTSSASPSTDGTESVAVTPPAPTIAGGLFSLDVTVQTTGSLSNQLAFLNAIRNAGPRRALLTSTQATPGRQAAEASIDGQSSFTTQLRIFSAPQTPEQVAQLNALLQGKIGN